MNRPVPINFNYYERESDHPDWDMIHEKAIERAQEIIPLIHKDSDDTIVDKAADKIRVAKSLATLAENFMINRKRWKQDEEAYACG